MPIPKRRHVDRGVDGAWFIVGLVLVLGAFFATWSLVIRSVGVDMSGLNTLAALSGLGRGQPPRGPVRQDARTIETAGLRVPGAAAATQQGGFCEPGEAPAFGTALGALRSQVGDDMGNPIECAHRDPANGDMLQRTSTGLAVYRESTNQLWFTDGWRHWAMTATGGVVMWEGTDADAPMGATTPAAT
jgi:hypothetical protein